MTSNDVTSEKKFFYDRLGSSEFTTQLVHVNTGDQLALNGLVNNPPLDISHGLRSLSFDDSNLIQSRLSFTKWRSQRSLLRGAEVEDKRKLNTDFVMSPLDSSAFDKHVELFDINDVNSLFFYTGGANNRIITALFNNFKPSHDDKFTSIPNDLLNDFERFKSKFITVVNNFDNKTSFKRILLTVAFNYYGGHTVNGYMTLDEYLKLVSIHDDLFKNNTMAKFVFDCMDRKHKSMITLYDFICGMLSCSPDTDSNLNTSIGKLRLQHIFRGYDLNRLGLLDEATLNIIFSHLYYLSNDVDDNLYKLNSDIKLNDELQDKLNIILQKYNGNVGYDDFYSCIEDGILNVDLLLRSNKDFGTCIMDNIILSMGNITIPIKPLNEVNNLTSKRRISLWNTTPKFNSTLLSPNVYTTNNEPHKYNNDYIYGDDYNKSVLGDFDVRNSVDLKNQWSPSFTVSKPNFHYDRLNSDENYCHIIDDKLKAAFKDSVSIQDNNDVKINPSTNDKTQHIHHNDYGVDNVGAQQKTPLNSSESLKVDDVETDELLILSSLENTLEERVLELYNRYKNRYKSDILIDDRIALNIFKSIYKRLFKCTNYNRFDKFEWCTYNEMINLFDTVYTLIRREDSLIYIDGIVQIHGDMNNDLYSLIDIFNTYGWPLHNNNLNLKCIPIKYIFISGFINNNNKINLEYLLFIFSLKILFPYHIYFICGDYEYNLIINKLNLYNNIYNILINNYNKLKLINNEIILIQSTNELINKIINIFNYMSIAIYINNNILCINGLISPQFNNLNQLYIKNLLVII